METENDMKAPLPSREEERKETEMATRIEIKYNSEKKEWEKLQAKLSRAEKAYEKKLAVAVKFGVDQMTAEEHTEWLKTVPTKDGWITDKEAVKRNGAWFDLGLAESEIADIERRIAVVEKHLAQLQPEIDAIKAETERKAGNRNVKVILDYLEVWKGKAFLWHERKAVQYPEARETFRKDLKEEHDWKEREKLRKQFGRTWAFITPYIREDNSFDGDKLKAELDREAEAMYDDLIARVEAVTGHITDACDLQISPKGNLDGYITGEARTAHVHTVEAGGYNIQCFHFRTLVHKA